MKKLFVILLVVLGCSTPRGNLKKISKDNAIGVISFKIFNTEGEDISGSCGVKYSFGKDIYTQRYKLDNVPHFLNLVNKFEVKNIMCMFNLLVYKYEFNGFNFKPNEKDAYLLGEYHFEYDYKGSYKETTFYAVAKRCEYDNIRSDKCENSSDTWTNDGKMKLIKIKRINQSVLSDSFPGHNKSIHSIDSIKPKNIL